MISDEYKEAIAEVLDILEHTREEDVNKIPKEFMNYLKENASQTYKSELDHTKKIEDMELNRKTKAILAIIYRDFWCDDQMKEEFEKVINNNELEYQKELRKKYNPDDLFKSEVSQTEKEENAITEVVDKESILKKFINKIKRIFHIK